MGCLAAPPGRRTEAMGPLRELPTQKRDVSCLHQSLLGIKAASGQRRTTLEDCLSHKPHVGFCLPLPDLILFLPFTRNHMWIWGHFMDVLPAYQTWRCVQEHLVIKHESERDILYALLYLVIYFPLLWYLSKILKPACTWKSFKEI